MGYSAITQAERDQVRETLKRHIGQEWDKNRARQLADIAQALAIEYDRKSWSDKHSALGSIRSIYTDRTNPSAWVALNINKARTFIRACGGIANAHEKAIQLELENQGSNHQVFEPIEPSRPVELNVGNWKPADTGDVEARRIIGPSPEEARARDEAAQRYHDAKNEAALDLDRVAMELGDDAAVELVNDLSQPARELLIGRLTSAFVNRDAVEFLRAVTEIKDL